MVMKHAAAVLKHTNTNETCSENYNNANRTKPNKH